MKLRPFVLAFCALVLVPIVALAITAQRAQTGVTIIINVTPNPLGYVRGAGATDMIVAHATLRGALPAIERVFEAQELHFLPTSSGTLVAQVQKSVRVEAEVTPNPTATLLTTNAAGSTVTLNAEAGVATAFHCVYTVTVQTAISGWQIKQGLSGNFAGTATSFPGGDLANNTYLSAGTPAPTATPFLVYTTDGGTFSSIGSTFNGTQSFCVDLTIDSPIATPQGTYSSNAIYTLYY